MIEQPTRRSLITGLVSLIAAPAIVRVASIMPVKPVGFVSYDLVIQPLTNAVVRDDALLIRVELSEILNGPFTRTVRDTTGKLWKLVYE